MSPVPLLRLGVSLLAGVRADDPRESPGRLLCSWACQVTCLQLLTIENPSAIARAIASNTFAEKGVCDAYRRP